MSEKKEKSDWMPGKRGEQLDMAINWFNVLSETHPLPDGSDETNAAAWGVSEAIVGALGPQVDVCFELLRKVKDPTTATAVIRNQCATAFVLLRHTMRELHAFFYLPTFSVAALERLGLSVHDDTPTAHPEPEIHVGSEFKPVDYGQVEMTIWVEESGERRIPTNMSGAVLFTQVSDTPITETSELHTSELYTTHRFVLSFPQELRGKTVYYSLRWQNKKGKRGQWSLIGSFVIP
ncbi:MAG: hypothetical protein LBS82_00980 [Spirochaetaceae bacterium]|jgi:hypothetical protein|nr:hypothetical protein [Spirochaetaceae bacterium]